MKVNWRIKTKGAVYLIKKKMHNRTLPNCNANCYLIMAII